MVFKVYIMEYHSQVIPKRRIKAVFFITKSMPGNCNFKKIENFDIFVDFTPLSNSEMKMTKPIWKLYTSVGMIRKAQVDCFYFQLLCFTWY